MAYTGPYPIKLFFTTTAMVVSNTSFSGGITISGTTRRVASLSKRPAPSTAALSITAAPSPAALLLPTARARSPGTGSTRTGIIIENTLSFGGGISNAGTISGSPTQGDLIGMFVSSVTNFRGGISNSGKISDNKRHFCLVRCEFWWRHQQLRHELRHFVGASRISRAASATGASRLRSVEVSRTSRAASATVAQSPSVLRGL